MNVYDNLAGIYEVLDEFIVETSELLEGGNEDLGRVITEIQVAVMQMHMLRISNVFRKFPRAVRDLSQERGLNENIDGLISQCFPRGRCPATNTDSEIQIVIDKLNNCPRKCFRSKTPSQVFFGIKPDVALLYGLPKYYHSGVK